MPKNYLSKVAVNTDRRARRRFKCKAVVRLVYKNAIRGPIISCRAVLFDISQVGALLSGAADDIPDYFYIVIGNFEYAIGCAVVRKDGSYFAVEFIKEQPQRLIEAFALLAFPMAPLFSLRGLMKNEMMQVSAYPGAGRE